MKVYMHIISLLLAATLAWNSIMPVLALPEKDCEGSKEQTQVTQQVKDEKPEQSARNNPSQSKLINDNKKSAIADSKSLNEQPLEMIAAKKPEVIRSGTYQVTRVHCLQYDVLSDQTVTITGRVGSEYTGSLEIPGTIEGLPVTSIADGAFSQCMQLEGNLVLPSSLKFIGEKAFYCCRNIKCGLTIPEGVMRIGDKAFAGIREINYVKLPLSLQYLGDAFDDLIYYVYAGTEENWKSHDFKNHGRIYYGCTEPLPLDVGVKYKYTPSTSEAVPYSYCKLYDNTIEIMGYGQYDARPSGKLIIPDQIEGLPISKIGEDAFTNCSDLTGDLIIPEGVVKIEKGAFAECTGFNGILSLPSTLQYIGGELGEYYINGAFCNCNGFKGNLVVKNQVTFIGAGAFKNCSGFDGTLTLAGKNISIGDFAFSGCSNFTGDLIIPEGSTLGSHAFEDCSSFNGNLTIGENVSSIGASAFCSCSGFQGKLTSGGDIKEIGDYAFSNCKNLQGEFLIPSEMTSIGECIYNNCEKLTGELVIPGTVTKIGNSAFANCKGLTGEVHIPDQVSEIGSYAFSDCTGLAGPLTLGKNIKTIGTRAFYNCSGLTGSLIIPEGVTDIASAAFRDCTGFDGELILPSTLRNIGGGNPYFPATEYDGAFYNCSSLSGNIVLPAALETVGTYAFIECKNINSFAAHNSKTVNIESPSFERHIKKIFYKGTDEEWTEKFNTGNYFGPDTEVVFNADISNFYQITIDDDIPNGKIENTDYNLYTKGEKVKVSISPDLGYRLKTVLVDGKPVAGNAFTVNGNHVISAKFEAMQDTGAVVDGGTCGESTAWTLYQDGNLQISGIGAMDSYASWKEVPWSVYCENDIKSVTVENTVEKIGNYAFYGMKLMNSIMIPDSVTDIGNYTFENCTGLSAVQLPNRLTKLGIRDFSGCSALQTIDIPNSVSQLGYGVFEKCTALSNLKLPEQIKSIDNHAFDGCCSLSELILPEQLETIGEFAFRNCTGLTSLTIPKNVTNIGKRFTDGCTGLTEYRVNPGNTAYKVDEGVLFTADGSTLIRLPVVKKGEYSIPSGVKTIGNYAFSDCTGLTEINIPDGTELLGEGAFENCSAITEIELPGTITKIDNAVCRGCSNLIRMMLPENITEIPQYAFSECKNLKELCFYFNVKSIGDNALFDCPNLNRILYIGNKRQWSETEIGYNNESVKKANITYGLPANGVCVVTTEKSTAGGTFSVGGKYFTKGEIISVTVTPDSTYYLKTVYVDENPIKGTEFTVTGNHIVRAEFAKYEHCLGSGTCGENLTWFVDDQGCMKICGEGPMSRNSNYWDYSWWKINNKVKTLIIEEGITSIGNNAFENFFKMKKVMIPGSVKTIGNYAFENCNSLEQVFYCGTQESWDDFHLSYNNEYLKNAKIKFYSAEHPVRMITVLQPENGQIYLNQWYVDGETIQIWAEPEEGYKLSEIVVDGKPIDGFNLTITGNHRISAEFRYYKECKSEIYCGPQARGYIYSDGELYICGIGAVETDEANKIPRDINQVIIDSGITDIGDSVFENCTISSVQLPDGLKSIGGNAFICERDTNCLGRVIIPESVTKLGKNAFSSGVSVEFLGNAPEFEGGYYETGFYTIYYHRNKSGWKSPEWNGHTCYCVEENIEDYSTLDSTNHNNQGVFFTLNGEDKTAIVGNYSDKYDAYNTSDYHGRENGCVVIPQVVIKNNVTYQVTDIGPHAFWSCSQLRQVCFEADLKAIDNYVFGYSGQLEKFECKNNLQNLRAVDGILYSGDLSKLLSYPPNKAQDSFTVPGSVRCICENAFLESKFLKEIIVPGSVQSFEEKAFNTCEALEKLTLPFVGKNRNDSGWGIEWMMSGLMPVLKTIVLTEDNLSRYAFKDYYSMKQVENIYLPNSLSIQTIPEGCFCECNSLKNIYIGNKKQLMENGVLRIPERTSEIGKNAFRECQSITTVYIPASLQNIGIFAFAECEHIKNFQVSTKNERYCSDPQGVLYTKSKDTLISYPAGSDIPCYSIGKSVKTLEGYAFDSCKNLMNLYVPANVITFSKDPYSSAGYAIGRWENQNLYVQKSSPADTYVQNPKLKMNYHYVDELKPDRMWIECQPDSCILDMEDANPVGLYVMAEFGDVQLQVADYDIAFTSEKPGPQKMEVSWKNKTLELPVIRCNLESSEVMDTGIKPEDEETVIVAVYSENGQMLVLEPTVLSGKTVQTVIPEKLYCSAAGIRAFTLKGNIPSRSVTILK